MIDVNLQCYLYNSPESLNLGQNEHMVWIARNNLKTVMKILSLAQGEIALPRRMIRERMASAHAWVGTIEYFENRSTARRHLLKSLTWLPFQPMTAAYLLLSFLPLHVVEALIGLERSIVDTLVG